MLSLFFLSQSHYHMEVHFMCHLFCMQIFGIGFDFVQVSYPVRMPTKSQIKEWEWHTCTMKDIALLRLVDWPQKNKIIQNRFLSDLVNEELNCVFVWSHWFIKLGDYLRFMKMIQTIGIKILQLKISREIDILIFIQDQEQSSPIGLNKSEKRVKAK